MSFSSSRVEVRLDDPKRYYSHGDTISGTAVVKLNQDETIKEIVAKLEGVARIVVPAGSVNAEGRAKKKDKDKDKEATVTFLHIQQVIFPDPKTSRVTSGKLTLGAGTYEYKFRFKIPEDTPDQARGARLLKGKSVSRFIDDIDHGHAFCNRLPPSMAPTAGKAASIDYFIKVTVQRPSVFKINLRNHDAFLFLPLDPRPLNSAEMSRTSFIRRDHNLTLAGFRPDDNRGFLKKMFGSGGGSDTPHWHFFLELQMSCPVIAKAAPFLPFKFLVVFDQPPPQQRLFLKGLTIVLVTTCQVAIEEYEHTFFNEEVIFNATNLPYTVPLNKATPVPGQPRLRAALIDPNIYKDARIPSHVSPTFTTQNIAKAYELKVSAAFCFNDGPVEVIELRKPQDIWSGISAGSRNYKGRQPTSPNPAAVTAPPPGYPPEKSGGPPAGYPPEKVRPQGPPSGYPPEKMPPPKPNRPQPASDPLGEKRRQEQHYADMEEREYQQSLQAALEESAAMAEAQGLSVPGPSSSAGPSSGALSSAGRPSSSTSSFTGSTPAPGGPGGYASHAPRPAGYSSSTVTSTNTGGPSSSLGVPPHHTGSTTTSTSMGTTVHTTGSTMNTYSTDATMVDPVPQEGDGLPSYDEVWREGR
ncbi:hypothetical protein B0I73DRAFT_127180 [Yarrowia lipolytica]|nr:hypothetical protein B0I73DRAFT_127180 [Yarrowia lipolytica]